MNKADVKIQLQQGNYQCVAVISHGNIRYIPVSKDYTATINIQEYEGVFVIPIQK